MSWKLFGQIALLILIAGLVFALASGNLCRKFSRSGKFACPWSQKKGSTTQGTQVKGLTQQQ